MDTALQIFATCGDLASWEVRMRSPKGHEGTFMRKSLHQMMQILLEKLVRNFACRF